MQRSSKIWVIINILGMIAYFLSERSLLNPSAERMGEETGFDYMYLWMTRELSIIIVFVVINMIWLISICGNTKCIKKWKLWSLWMLICMAWVGTIAFRGTSIAAVRVILGG
jgi:hypothetical protein